MSVILSVLCYLLGFTHSDSVLISTLISNYRSAQAANIQSHHDMNQLKWVFIKRSDSVYRNTSYLDNEHLLVVT